MIKQTKAKIVKDRIKKYAVSIDDLDKNSIIDFKEKIKYLTDSRQKAKKVYKICNVINLRKHDLEKVVFFSLNHNKMSKKPLTPNFEYLRFIKMTYVYLNDNDF